MYDNFFLNLDTKIFYKYYKTFTEKNLCNILNNSKNINDYLEIDILNMNNIFNKLNNNVKNIIIENININNLFYLYKNNKISKYDIWKNKNLYKDINLTIRTLYKINLLFLINEMDISKFKIYISKIYFYNLKYLYPIIKNCNLKFKIFINGIDELFLNNLINYFDIDSINFLNLNYCNLFRFIQISEFSQKSIDEINNMEINKLKIILLLRTSNEYKIKKHILEKDNKFIKNIINLVEISNFIYIMKNIKISIFYDIFDVLELSKIKILLPHLNTSVLSRIFLKLDLLKLNSLIESLSLNQFIECLYFISDDKLECLKNMNSEQKFYIENLCSNIDDNLYELYFPFFSKQVILCMLNTNKKNLILENINNINFENIKSIIRYLNVEEIIYILNEFNNIDQKIEIIEQISNKQFEALKKIIEDDLLNNINISNQMMINYKLIHSYIDLDFNKMSDKKIKDSFNIENL